MYYTKKKVIYFINIHLSSPSTSHLMNPPSYNQAVGEKEKPSQNGAPTFMSDCSNYCSCCCNRSCNIFQTCLCSPLIFIGCIYGCIQGNDCNFHYNDPTHAGLWHEDSCTCNFNKEECCCPNIDMTLYWGRNVGSLFHPYRCVRCMTGPHNQEME